LAVAALGYSFGGADKLSRPDNLSLDATTEAIYRYTGLGWVTGVSYVGISPDPVEMSYGSGDSGLDSFGRIIETLWKKGPDVMQKASYGYDRASNRKWRREDLAHDLGGTQATRHDNFYHYDGLDQVVGRELGELVGTPPNYTGITGAIQDESWSYDATGNWQKYDSAAEANLQQTRCHNAANEITRVTNPGGVIEPAYDKVGNQTLDIAPGDWDRGFSLKWDAWNRLIEVKDGNTPIQTNAYDGLSRRITSSDGTEITHYYYNDAWRSVEEYTDADPDDPACRYLWGLRSRWDLVKRERNISGTLDEKRYVLYDAMDPVAICDEDGEVVRRFEYSPFGRTTFLDPDFAPDATPANWTFLFHGEFRDEATGYYNYGFRFYNDTTGRWPSRDPIGERGGINLYAFVGNCPIDHFDYLGHSTLTAHELDKDDTACSPTKTGRKAVLIKWIVGGMKKPGGTIIQTMEVSGSSTDCRTGQTTTLNYKFTEYFSAGSNDMWEVLMLKCTTGNVTVTGGANYVEDYNVPNDAKTGHPVAKEVPAVVGWRYVHISTVSNVSNTVSRTMEAEWSCCSGSCSS
jgi:RHS repeat-associated protein